MTGCYLDSNFLIYVKNEDASQHVIATAKLKQLTAQEQSLYVSPLILDEFIHGFCTLIRIKTKINFSTVKQVLKNILGLPRLEIINIPNDVRSQIRVLDLMQKYSLHARDAYHLITMQINGIRNLATFDKDFNKVFSVKLLNKI